MLNFLEKPDASAQFIFSWVEKHCIKLVKNE